MPAGSWWTSRTAQRPVPCEAALHPHISRSYHVRHEVVCSWDLAQKCCPVAWRGCCANTAVCIALPLLTVTTSPSASVFSRACSIALFTCAYETPEQIPRSLPLTRCVPLDRLPSTSSSVNQLCMWTVSGGWKCLMLRRWVTALRECYKF